MRPFFLRKNASSLVTTLFVITVLAVIMVAFMQSMQIERMTSRSYANIERARLASEAGLNEAISAIRQGIEHPDAGGVAYTTWNYFPEGAEGRFFTALTVGRPANLSATNFLNDENTRWLFSRLRADADEQDIDLPSVLPSDPDMAAALPRENLAALHEIFRLGNQSPEILVPWFELAREPAPGGAQQILRFAFWVEDESGRLNLLAPFDSGQLQALIDAGEELAGLRQSGSTAGELISDSFLTAEELKQTKAVEKHLRSALAIRQVLGTNSLARLDALGEVTTIFSRSSNRIQYAPPATGTPGSFNRGMRKLNLNWPGLTNSATAVQSRVDEIANALENGAPEFLGSSVAFYQNSTPDGEPPDHAAPSWIRREMRETIAASIIDWMDADHIPTQPDTLFNPSDPDNPPPPVEFIANQPRPRFFGAELAPVLNEVSIIWNAEPGETRARDNMDRSGSAATVFTYRIPVLWRFELWNMNDLPIPARDYSVRICNMTRIPSSAFGANPKGEAPEPIPPDTELVLPLGQLSFAPGEIKMVEYSETFESAGQNDLGTTWSRFRLGKDGLGGLGPGSDDASSADDLPERHSRMAMILFDPTSNRWISSTNFLQSFNILDNGTAVWGIGNMGASLGTRINDPRSQPLRGYALDDLLAAEAKIGSHDFERDWSGQSPGSGSTLNNNVGGRYYQHLGFWFDRPKLAAGNDGKLPLPGIAVAHVANRPMKNIGELGNIFDPSWHNPINRGSDTDSQNRFPYRTGVRSPFRGGATLRIGQPDGQPLRGANSWAIADVLDVDFVESATGGTTSSILPSTEKFSADEKIGAININTPKVLTLGATNFVSTAEAFRLHNFDADNDGTRNPYLPEKIAEAILSRLVKSPAIPNWQQARPFYSAGEISELAIWADPDLYSIPITTHAHPATNPKAPRRLNLSDRIREQAVQKSLSLLTTSGRVFRVYCVGQVLLAPVGGSAPPRVLATSRRRVIADFRTIFDEANGHLLEVRPVILSDSSD